MATPQQQIQQARTQLQQRQAETEKIKSQLKEQKQKLPEVTTQEALRRQGLTGRQVRQEVTRKKEEIKTKEQAVKQYEQQLKQYQEQVTKAQTQVKEQQLKQAAIARAKELYRKGRTSEMITSDNPYVTKYLDELHRTGELRAELVEKIEADEAPPEIEARIERMKKAGLSTEEAYKELGFKLEEPTVTEGIVTQEPDEFIGKTYIEGDKVTLPGGYISGFGTMGGIITSEGVRGGTAFIRPVTPEEYKVIEDIKVKEQKILEAPSKFLAGEYKWQQKILPLPEKDKPTPEQIAIYEQKTPYGELWKEGRFPSIIRKGFYDIGTIFQRRVSTPVTEKITGEKITLTQEKQLGRLTGTVFLFGAFSPLMQTGTAQQSEYVYDYSKQRFVKKIDVDKYAKIQALKQELSKSSAKEIKSYLNKQLNLIKKSNLPAIEKQKLAQELYATVSESRGGIVIRDVSGKIVRADTLTKEAISTKPFVIEVDISELIKAPQMKYVGPTGASIKVLTKDTAKDVLKVKVKEEDILGVKQQVVQKTKLRAIPQFRFKTKQEEVTKQMEIEKLGEKLKQKQKLTSLLALRYKQVQAQKQIQKQEYLRPTPQKPIPKKPTPTKIVIRLPGTTIQRLAKKVEAEPDLFKVFVTKVGKEVEVGEFPTLKAAKKGLIKELKTTLRAGGFITKAEKPIEFGKLGITSPEFRPSKVSPFKVIQKKRRRFGTRLETAEAQYFRKKSGAFKLL